MSVWNYKLYIVNMNISLTSIPQMVIFTLIFFSFHFFFVITQPPLYNVTKNFTVYTHS